MGRTKLQKNVKRDLSSVPVKQRIRSCKRLLNKPNLSAAVRVAQERMLKLLENKLEEGPETNKKRLIGQKYKKVKFFEKRKLWRQYKATNKELQEMSMSSSSDRGRELEEMQKKIMRDLNYVEHYPYDRKYISLFPKQPYDNPDVITEQGKLHREINEKVDSGQLSVATFGNNSKEFQIFQIPTKCKLKSSTHAHMLDKRKESKKDRISRDRGQAKSCLDDDDDFFIA